MSDLSQTFALSQHASTRMAQRGIGVPILDILLTYGAQTPADGTCESYRLLHRTARQLASDGYDARLLKSAVKLCAVVSSDGIVVTCFHGTPRPERPARRKDDNWRRARNGGGR